MSARLRLPEPWASAAKSLGGVKILAAALKVPRTTFYGYVSFRIHPEVSTYTRIAEWFTTRGYAVPQMGLTPYKGRKRGKKKACDEVHQMH